MSQASSMPVVVPKAAEIGPRRDLKKRVPAAVTVAFFVVIIMGKITVMVTIMATIMVTIMATKTAINIKIKMKKGAKRIHPIS